MIHADAQMQGTWVYGGCQGYGLSQPSGGVAGTDSEEMVPLDVPMLPLLQSRSSSSIQVQSVDLNSARDWRYAHKTPFAFA